VASGFQVFADPLGGLRIDCHRLAVSFPLSLNPQSIKAPIFVQGINLQVGNLFSAKAGLEANREYRSVAFPHQPMFCRRVHRLRHVPTDCNSHR
jgi:hypothetical protein